MLIEQKNVGIQEATILPPPSRKSWEGKEKKKVRLFQMRNRCGGYPKMAMVVETVREKKAFWVSGAAFSSSLSSLTGAGIARCRKVMAFVQSGICEREIVCVGVEERTKRIVTKLD